MISPPGALMSRPTGGFWESAKTLAVEFDNVAVGIEYIELRIAGDGVGTQDHPAKFTGRGVFAISFRAQRFDRLAEALDPYRKMDIEGIERLVLAEGSVGADHDVNLQSVPKLKPSAGIAKVRPGNLLQLENLAIELPRPFQVSRGYQYVMKRGRIHRKSLSYRSHSSRCCFTKESSFKCGYAR